MNMKSPYETMVLRRSNISKLEQKLKEMVITKQVKSIDQEGKYDFGTYRILGVAGEVEIPYFYQPIIIELPEQKPTIVVDFRAYAGVKLENDIIHRNKTNETTNFIMVYAIAMGEWMKDADSLILTQDLPINTYGALVAETVARRLGLDPESTLRLMAAFQLFYATRTVKDIQNIKPEELASIATILSRKMKVDIGTHMQIVEMLEASDLKDIDSFMKKIRELAWSPRLSKLTVGDLTIMLAGGWISQGNPKETMAVAIEFPPAWLAINFTCAKNKFYQKLPLGQIMKRLDRNGALGTFVSGNTAKYFGPVYE